MGNCCFGDHNMKIQSLTPKQKIALLILCIFLITSSLFWIIGAFDVTYPYDIDLLYRFDSTPLEKIPLSHLDHKITSWPYCKDNGTIFDAFVPPCICQTGYKKTLVQSTVLGDILCVPQTCLFASNVSEISEDLLSPHLYICVLAVAKEKPGTCGLISDSSRDRDICLAAVFSKNRSKEVCEFINSPPLKERCFREASQWIDLYY